MNGVANSQSLAMDTVVFYPSVEFRAYPQSEYNLLPIDNYKIAASGRRLSELLGASSAIYIKDYGVGQLSTLSLQGASAAQTQLTWNGVKINSPSTGMIDLSLIDFSTLDHLEIRNTGTDGLIGGSVDIASTPSVDRFNSTQLLRVGSFGLFNIVSSNDYRAGIFTGSTRIGYLRADNDFTFRNDMQDHNPLTIQHHSFTKQLSVSQHLGFNLSPKVQWKTDLWITDAQREIPPTMAQTISKAVQDDGAYRAVTSIKYLARKYTIGASFALLYDYIRYQDIGASIDSRSKSLSSRNLISIQSMINSRWSVDASLHYDYEQVHSSGYLLTPHRNTIGATLNTHYQLSRQWSIKLSAKQEIADNRGLPLAPAIDLTWDKISNHNHIRISLSGYRAYRLPTLNDLYWKEGGNPTLRPERSWGGHFVTNYSWNEQINCSSDVFLAYISDWILWHPLSNGIWTPENVKTVVSGGWTGMVQVSNRKGINPKKCFLQSTLSYTYTHTYSPDAISNHDQSAGQQLIYVPLHRLIGSLLIQYYGCYIRPTLSYTSARYTTSDHSESLAPFTLVGVEMGKSIPINKQTVSISIKINNLTQANYQLVEGYATPGRWIEASIKLNMRE